MSSATRRGLEAVGEADPRVAQLVGQARDVTDFSEHPLVEGVALAGPALGQLVGLARGRKHKQA